MAEAEHWVVTNLLWILETVAFIRERLITMSLPIIWICGCYFFLVYSQEFAAFKNPASLCTHLLLTNAAYFLAYLFKPFLNRALPARATHDQSSMTRNEWHDIERLAFWIERFGMFLVVIPEIVQLSYHRKILIFFFPCTMLFPFANILYLQWFLISRRQNIKNQVGSKKVENGIEKNKMEGNKTEKSDALSKEEIANLALAESVKKAEEKYKKKMLEFEKKWVKKLEIMQEKRSEDCKYWKEQEEYLLSKIVCADSEVEFYYVQALESTEKLRILEDEKNELITRLNIVNAAAELYCRLLREPCCTQDHCPSFSDSEFE